MPQPASELTCDHCDADCSASYARTMAVRRRGSEVELVGKGVRCRPPCEPALKAARELLAELEAERAQVG